VDFLKKEQPALAWCALEAKNTAKNLCVPHRAGALAPEFVVGDAAVARPAHTVAAACNCLGCGESPTSRCMKHPASVQCCGVTWAVPSFKAANATGACGKAQVQS
jgi:hypothetical protein